MSRYQLRPVADDDLEEIWRYTARRWSVDQADRYYRSFVTAFEALAETPTLGRACDEIRPGYRRYNVGSHVAFYFVEDEKVHIVRVLHARRDFRRHLPAI